MYNSLLITAYDEHRNSKRNGIVSRLKSKLPTKSDLEILEIYDECISIHQSRQQGSGSFLENYICNEILVKNDIPFKYQVSIDDDGIIIGFNVKKNVSHVVDIVIGTDIEIGKSITEFKVVSCKTTCRERWTQDKWSLTHPPRMFVLATLSDDYPSSSRFNESETRRIVSSVSKANDNRLFRLDFDNLLDLIL